MSATARTYVYDGWNAALINSDFFLEGLNPDEYYARVNTSGTTSFNPAIILCRVQRSITAFDRVTRQLEALLRSALPTSPTQ